MSQQFLKNIFSKLEQLHIESAHALVTISVGKTVYTEEPLNVSPVKVLNV